MDFSIKNKNWNCAVGDLIFVSNWLEEYSPEDAMQIPIFFLT